MSAPLIAMFGVQAVLILAGVGVLWWWVVRRGGGSKRLVAVGAGCFVASQVVHIPLNLGLTALFAIDGMWNPPLPVVPYFNAVLLGFTAGLCEEWARYLFLTRVVKSARSYGQGIAFGAGHGGIEAVFVAGLGVISVVTMIAMHSLGIDGLGIPEDQRPAVEEQMSTFWSMPAWMPLLAVVERIFAVTLHLALTLVVLDAIRLGRSRRVWLAVLLHTAANAVALSATHLGGPVAAEIALAVFTAIPIAILVSFRRRLGDEATDPA